MFNSAPATLDSTVADTLVSHSALVTLATITKSYCSSSCMKFCTSTIAPLNFGFPILFPTYTSKPLASLCASHASNVIALDSSPVANLLPTSPVVKALAFPASSVLDGFSFH